jgi:hypothetical protein
MFRHFAIPRINSSTKVNARLKNQLMRAEEAAINPVLPNTATSISVFAPPLATNKYAV